MKPASLYGILSLIFIFEMTDVTTFEMTRDHFAHHNLENYIGGCVEHVKQRFPLRFRKFLQDFLHPNSEYKKLVGISRSVPRHCDTNVELTLQGVMKEVTIPPAHTCVRTTSRETATIIRQHCIEEVKWRFRGIGRYLPNDQQALVVQQGRKHILEDVVSCHKDKLKMISEYLARIYNCSHGF